MPTILVEWAIRWHKKMANRLTGDCSSHGPGSGSLPSRHTLDPAEPDRRSDVATGVKANGNAFDLSDDSSGERYVTRRHIKRGHDLYCS